MSEKRPQSPLAFSEKPTETEYETQYDARSEKSRRMSPAAEESPLERFNSMCSANLSRAGMEPMAAGPGVAMMSESKRGVHHNYYFARLAEERPLPGKKHEWAML